MRVMGTLSPAIRWAIGRGTVGILAILLAGAPRAAAQSDFVRGDMNCDGVVDLRDTAQTIFDTTWAACKDAEDWDDNGLITLNDLIGRIMFLKAGGPPPAPPYPDCGPDPTPDALSCDSVCCGGASSGCSVSMTGDVNLSGTLTSADIIALVNFVFKSAAPPLPCRAAGDVNCSGTVTSADIIGMVGFVFKSGPPPCDICAMIPEIWSCP